MHDCVYEYTTERGPCSWLPGLDHVSTCKWKVFRSKGQSANTPLLRKCWPRLFHKYINRGFFLSLLNADVGRITFQHHSLESLENENSVHSLQPNMQREYKGKDTDQWNKRKHLMQRKIILLYMGSQNWNCALIYSPSSQILL